MKGKTIREEIKDLKKTINKLNLQIAIETEQRRLLWSYTKELTDAYNKLSESLGSTFMTMPYLNPDQKKLKGY